MSVGLAGPPIDTYPPCLSECEACPYGGPAVGSRGNVESEIVFMGEGPGREERKIRYPLVGPSGHVFWNSFPNFDLLREWGVKPEEFYILNAVQCFPPHRKTDAKFNTQKTRAGAVACWPRLIQEISAHPRKLIVAMGNHALWSITGNEKLKITQVRGQLIPSSLSELGILPVVHPAALLRGTGNYRQFRVDIEYATDLLRGIQRVPLIDDPQWVVCDTLEKMQEALVDLWESDVIDCDTETTGFNRFEDETLAIGMSKDPNLVYIFPGAVSNHRLVELHAHQDWCDGAESMIPYLSEFMREYRRADGRGNFKGKARPGGRAVPGKFCWHNGKFDVSFSRREQCESHVDDDTMLMSYALDEQGGIHDLEQVASDLLKAPDYKHVLKPWVPKKKDSYCKIPKSILYPYLAKDVSRTGQIRQIFRRRVAEDPKLEKFYTRVLIPASEELWHVEQRGMVAHKFAVERQQKRLQKVIDACIEHVNQEAAKVGYDGSLNPASPLQMQVFFYDILKFPLIPHKARSCDKDVVEKWLGDDAKYRIKPQYKSVVVAYKDFKKAAKAKGTYADTILLNMQSDGRVHPTYLLHGTRTGRLAHKIIANIPRDRRIRGMYRAANGHVYVKADLNQAELRSLAHLSGDPALCAIYSSTDRSIHKEVANQIWGSPGTTEGKKSGEYKWGNEEYMRAKALNFGIVYGRQAASIAEEFGISEREAQTYIDTWKNTFPVAWAFIQKCRNAVLQGKTLVTPFGSKKRHWIVTRENLIALQNEASNFPHQNIASNINLCAAITLGPQLRAKGCYIVNLVHDELITECPDDPTIIEWAKNLITSTLEATAVEWGLTRIPFKSDASVGKRWGVYRAKDKKGKWAAYLAERANDNETRRPITQAPPHIPAEVAA